MCLIIIFYFHFQGFITDGNSKLVGSARLRQVRVKRDSCKIAKSMRHAVPDCSAPYSWENEDLSSYGPGWDEFHCVNGSEDTVTAWKYQSQSALKAIPVWVWLHFIEEEAMLWTSVLTSKTLAGEKSHKHDRLFCIAKVDPTEQLTINRLKAESILTSTKWYTLPLRPSRSY